MYSHQKNYTPFGFNIDFGTFTASGANSVLDVAPTLPKFQRRATIVNARLRCTAIPNAAATGLVAVLLNGTKTAASWTLTTATADQFLDATIVSSNASNRFEAGIQPTIKVIGTSTASGGNLGDFDIWAEVE